MYAKYCFMVINLLAKHSMTMSQEKQEAHGPHPSPEKTVHMIISSVSYTHLTLPTICSV